MLKENEKNTNSDYVNKYYKFINKAEEFIISKKGTPQTFSAIWKYICKQLDIKKEDADKLIGEFHLTLTLHKKFLYLGSSKRQTWGLKKYYSLKELNRLQKRNIFYDDDDQVDLESDLIDHTVDKNKIKQNDDKIITDNQTVLDSENVDEVVENVTVENIVEKK